MSDDADDQRPPPDAAGIVAAAKQIGTSGVVEAAEGIVDAVREIGKTGKAKQTWREWMPEGIPEPFDYELLGREEVVERLRQSNVPMTARTLRLWEAQGMLPHPVRKHFKGATRATYPPWFVNLAVLVNAAKLRGDSVERIAEQAPGWVELDLRRYWSGRQGIWDAEAMGVTLPGALRELAEAYEAVSGDRPAIAELKLRRADGETLITYAIPIPDPDAPSE
jgi:hypothetical protein